MNKLIFLFIILGCSYSSAKCNNARFTYIKEGKPKSLVMKYCLQNGSAMSPDCLSGKCALLAAKPQAQYAANNTNPLHERCLQAGGIPIEGQLTVYSKSKDETKLFCFAKKLNSVVDPALLNAPNELLAR